MLRWSSVQNTFQFNLSACHVAVVANPLWGDGEKGSDGEMNIGVDTVRRQWLGAVLGIGGGKKEERCISGPEIAVVYSSANPKFCADPTVARKQLTVKWGDQRD